MFVITAASGKTGSRVAAALLADKKPVRLVVRSGEKVAALKARGAEIAAGSLADAAFLKSALDGCAGAYLVTPLDFGSADPEGEEIAVGKRYAEALAGTQAHVVYLSVLKARDKTGIPHFESKAEIESALDAACANLTILRPGFFMENFFAQLPSLGAKRTTSYPLPHNRPIAMVSCNDIAEVVRQAFLRGPKGKEAYDLLGYRCYTMAECARMIGNSIGRPVHYRRASDDDFAKQMKAHGASERAVSDLLTMFRYMMEKEFTGDFDGVRKAFKSPAVLFEKVADEIAGALRASGGRK
ncbi:MAG: NmrA family NAD(P)-binding protein [Acidobacteriota bacterium]